jgi:hypothetical protein
VRFAIIFGVVVIAGVLIDRLALWAESRGWIYWRRSSRHGSTSSGVLGAMDEVLQPARYEARIELEHRRELREDSAPEGDPLRQRPNRASNA